MKRALWLMFTLGGLLTGCDRPRPLVSQGHTRFLSDRACEIDATVSGTRSPAASGLAASDPAGDLWRRAAALAAAGKPLWLEHARVSYSPSSSPLTYEARVESFARLEPARLYHDEPGVSFRWPPAQARETTPRYAALVVDGVLRVGAVFGQMRPDEPSPTADDEGWWSWHALREALVEQGYLPADDLAATAERLAGDPAITLWRHRVGDIVVEVELLGPDSFSFEGDDAAGARRLRALLGRSSVVYVNGHAQRPAFAPLDEPDSYRPARSRLLVLDLCWSYFDHARRVLDAAGDAQVVTTDGRVVTGSVGSFAGLLAGLVDGASRPAAGARWLTLLGAMNDGAAARARARAGQVDDRMEDPEIYGVSPAW